MTNENIEEKKAEITVETIIEPTEDHVIFECAWCNKVFDQGRDVIDDVGSRADKRNYGPEKYIHDIWYNLPENEKCDKSEDEQHLLITSHISSKVIDNIVQNVNKDNTEIVKKENEGKSILVKKSQQEKEVVDLQLKMDELTSNIAKLDENHIKIQSEKSILVNDIENQRSKFKSFTGTGNIEKWMEIKKK